MHPQWLSLLSWLDDHGTDTKQFCVDSRATTDGFGYGMFALRDLLPSTPLFTIHKSALLNSLTLESHYPKFKPALTCSQIISLHLFLHRPSQNGSLDPLFGPYIATLPENFDAHPLTWLLKQRLGVQGPVETRFLTHLPPFVARDVERIARTFDADWKRILGYLGKHPDVLTQATNTGLSTFSSDPAAGIWDFLWGWLNVNTRCIHYRVKANKNDRNNLTMCPVLDFANHSPTTKSASPLPSKCDIWDIAPRRGNGDNFTLVSPPGSVREGQEVFLRYGHHTNQTLFTEYGFVNPMPSGVSDNKNDTFGNVDVSPVVQHLFIKRGAVGAWMKSVLEEEGYWWNWTLHASPSPAHPDYRMITALRLYHLLPVEATQVPKNVQDSILRPWREVMIGNQDSISEENEKMWRQTLVELCFEIIGEANAHVEHFSKDGDSNAVKSWPSYTESCIQVLWKEERAVAEAVIKSIKEGVIEF